MTKEQKITIKKKMSNRDYISLAYFLEDKEIPSFDDKDTNYLSTVQVRYMRVTREGKEKIDKFLDRYILGVSADTLFNEIPDKKKPVQMQPIVVQQTVTTQTTATSDSKDSGDNKDNNTTTTDTTPDKVVYPVYDKETRWQIAKDMEREPIRLYDEDNKELPHYKLPRVNITDYPFIKNHNEPLCWDNFDIDMMCYLLERDKVSANEIFKLLEQEGARFLWEQPSYQVPNIPKCYSDCIDFANVIMTAQDYSCRYKDWKKNAEPSEDEVLKRYTEYLAYEVFEKNGYNHPDLKNCMTIMSKIDNINNDTVTLITDDDDMVDTIDLKYDDLDSMIQDLLSTKWHFKPELNRDYNMFGKKMSIMDYVKKMYKKHPDGIEGYATFYKSEWYKFLAGKLSIRPNI